jgi:5-methylcytosine-specific restriction endonuclease McrA
MPWSNSTTNHLRLQGSARQQRNRRVLRRDGAICHICRQPGADTVDHVLALARGGSDHERNLAAAHEACNAAKARRPVEQGGDRLRLTRRRPPAAHPCEVHTC